MKTAFLTVDLSYGDSGKGTIVDALVRRYNAGFVVRYNGGPQAAHTVIDKAGQCHIFNQFGSGTLYGAKTFLSRFMLVSPLLMQEEATRLHNLGFIDALRMVFVDERAIVITPYHRAVNRLRELVRGDQRHGSCGMGVGETMHDLLTRPDGALSVKDIVNGLVVTKLAETRAVMKKIAYELAASIEHRGPDPEVTRELSTFDVELKAVLDRIADWGHRVNVVPDPTFLIGHDHVVFEGAQGVLLDERYGFHPYTTWSKTTLDNAKQILHEIGHTGDVMKIGITRTYATRHGPGPFVTESKELTDVLPDSTNTMNMWQREFRVGQLDIPALQYAVNVNGYLDSLAITHVDRLSTFPNWPVCTSYEADILHPAGSLTDQEKVTNRLLNTGFHSEYIPQNEVVDFIKMSLNTPIGIISRGPMAEDKKFH